MITNIKIRKIFEDHERLEALISATFYGKFVVHDIKIINGQNRTFVAMPSRRDKMGNFRDIIHPIDKGFREELEKEIIEGYEAEKAKLYCETADDVLK